VKEKTVECFLDPKGWRRFQDFEGIKEKKALSLNSTLLLAFETTTKCSIALPLLL
jgi:hypothetical protein